MYIVRVYDCSISLLLHAPYAKYAYISKYMRYLAEMLPIRRTTKQAIRTIFSCPICFKTFWWNWTLSEKWYFIDEKIQNTDKNL